MDMDECETEKHCLRCYATGSVNSNKKLILSLYALFVTDAFLLTSVHPPALHTKVQEELSTEGDERDGYDCLCSVLKKVEISPLSQVMVGATRLDERRPLAMGAKYD